MKRALLYQLSYAPIPLDTDYSAETTNDSATNSAHLLHRFANRPSIDDGASNFASNVLINKLCKSLSSGGPTSSRIERSHSFKAPPSE